MPSIILDFDPPLPGGNAFSGDQSDLVYFLSWAYSSRYGAQHELSLAALTLQAELKIDIRPLLTFADRDVEVEVDQETLDLSWQDALPVATSCARVADALESGDARFAPVAEGYPRLALSIRELGDAADRQATRGGRIRITYLMEDE